MEHCLCYGREREAVRPEFGECAPRAHELTEIFLRRLPEIRRLLVRDVQAAFDGDPAATNLDEVILAYPGVLAVSVYRIAHALYDLGVPMMARIMTEWAHSKTGCDIHPGAKIGAAFFIDHATGVVIGETTEIGEGVKLYQGVTLGALSFPRDASGQIIRGRKRHPTVESGATLYANATVLGGQTVVGANSVIGGSVFLTRSVPPRSRVSLKEPELRVAIARRCGRVRRDLFRHLAIRRRVKSGPTRRARSHHLAEHRHQQQGDDVDDLDQRIDRRTRRVLVGVAHGVAGHGGLVRIGSLAAEVALFDVFLGIVPGAAAGGHRYGDEQSGDDGPDEQAAERLHAGSGAHQPIHDEYQHDRHDDRQQRRHDHLLDRSLRQHVDGARIVGLRRAFHDALDVAELPPHLVDHRAGGASHGFHRHGGEHVGDQTADEQAR